MRARDDDGVTLVELIVTISLSAIVLALIAVTFVNGITAQRDGVARDAATGQTNVVATTLATSIRNSGAVRVSGAGTRLDAVYIAPNGTPECRAWAVVTKSGVPTLVYRASKTGAVPTATSAWTTLAKNVTGTLTAGAVFSAVGVKTVQIGMEVKTDQVKVAVTDGVTAQALGQESVMTAATTAGRLPCWP